MGTSAFRCKVPLAWRVWQGLAYAQAYLTYRQGGGPLGGNDPARNPNRAHGPVAVDAGLA